MVEAQTPKLASTAEQKIICGQEIGLMPTALRQAGTIDAGSVALEHSTDTPAGRLSPPRFRRARRILATSLSTLEAAQLSPGNLKDNLKFGVKLVTTDPYAQSIESQNTAAKAAPNPDIRHA